jgi:hypothetical protein
MFVTNADDNPSTQAIRLLAEQRGWETGRQNGQPSTTNALQDFCPDHADD